MVFYLIQDVCDHGIDLGLADAEGSVTSLPLEIRVGGEVIADPGVGGSFEFLHPVSQRGRAAQTSQHMNVIFDAPHTNDGAVEAIGDLPKIGVELIPAIEVLKDRKAMFCGEDEVDTNR